MSTYVKTFSSIVNSSVWAESDATLRIWITMLVMADRDGLVEASILGIVKQSGKTLSEVETALEKFTGPDPYSRSKAHGGRRVEVVDGGFMILNYEKYQDQKSKEDTREKAAARQRRKYERDKAKGLAAGGTIPEENTKPHATSRYLTPSGSADLIEDLNSPAAKKEQAQLGRGSMRAPF